MCIRLRSKIRYCANESSQLALPHHLITGTVVPPQLPSWSGDLRRGAVAGPEVFCSKSFFSSWPKSFWRRGRSAVVPEVARNRGRPGSSGRSGSDAVVRSFPAAAVCSEIDGGDRIEVVCKSKGIKFRRRRDAEPEMTARRGLDVTMRNSILFRMRPLPMSWHQSYGVGGGKGVENTPLIRRYCGKSVVARICELVRVHQCRWAN